MYRYYSNVPYFPYCRCPSERVFLRKESNEDWMAELGSKNPSFRKKPINRIAMPGTHDSGMNKKDTEDQSRPAPDIWDVKSYTTWALAQAAQVFVRPWAITQKKRMKEQLESGSRYFDFRIAPQVNNHLIRGYEVSQESLYTIHGVYGEKLDKIIKAIKEFLDKNQEEVVVLHFQHFYEMTSNSYKKLGKMIQDNLGKWLVPTSGYPLTTPLERLQRDNKRVFVVIGKDHQRYKKSDDPFNYLDANYFWDKSAIDSKWFDTTSIDILEKKSTENVLKMQGYPGLWVLQEVLTPDLGAIAATVMKNLTSVTGSLELLEKDIPKLLPKWIQNWNKHGWYLNIVMVDFIDSSFARSTIDSNNVQ